MWARGRGVTMGQKVENLSEVPYIPPGCNRQSSEGTRRQAWGHQGQISSPGAAIGACGGGRAA